MTETALTDIQRRLLEAYKDLGYERIHADTPQSRGELLMRRELERGQAVLQIIFPDGRTITRAVSRSAA